jgi:hypothetical protein
MKHVSATTIGLAIGFTLALAVPAYPHGGGVIRVASKQVAVGGTIALAGEKLEKNADLRLELRGTLDNYPAGRVRTDAGGRLSASITIPPAVPIGAHTLVAIATDGDVTARTDLAVGPAADVAASKEGMPHMATEMPAMQATAEMMKIERTTTPSEWAMIAAVIVLSFGGGAFLLLRSRRTAIP